MAGEGSTPFGGSKFEFSEAKIKSLCEAVVGGTIEPREWTDSGSGVGLTIRVGPRGGKYYSNRRVNRVKRRILLGYANTMRLKTAREKAAAIVAGLDAGSRPIRNASNNIDAQAVFESYLEAAQAGTFAVGRKAIKASTAKSYVELWSAHVQRAFGARPLGQLASEVPRLHAGLAKHPATQKRLLQLLKNVFEHSHRQGIWREPNPTLDQATGKPIRCLGVPDRERYLSDSELVKFLEWTGRQAEPWKDYFRLLLLTGQRKSTLLAMKWGDVELEGDGPCWRIAEAKNGRPLTVALLPEAVDILRHRKPRFGEDRWVFPSSRGSACGHIRTAEHAFQRMLKATGLQDVRIHDIRRTAGTIAVKNHSLPDVARFLGHRSLRSVAVYARATPEGARCVGESVAAAFRKATT